MENYLHQDYLHQGDYKINITSIMKHIIYNLSILLMNVKSVKNIILFPLSVLLLIFMIVVYFIVIILNYIRFINPIIYYYPTSGSQIDLVRNALETYDILRNVVEYINIEPNPIELIPYEKHFDLSNNGEKYGFNTDGYRYSERILSKLNTQNYSIEQLSDFCDILTWSDDEERIKSLDSAESNINKFNKFNLLQLGNLSYMYLYDPDENIRNRCAIILKSKLT